MSIANRRNNSPFAIEIIDILETSERIVKVVLKNGKPFSIRRDLAEFSRGRVYIPYWLAKKVLPASRNKEEAQYDNSDHAN